MPMLRQRWIVEVRRVNTEIPGLASWTRPSPPQVRGVRVLWNFICHLEGWRSKASLGG